MEATTPTDAHPGLASFKSFHSAGPETDGTAFIRSCLAQPEITLPTPTASPGDASALFPAAPSPCNICVGNAAVSFATPEGVNYSNPSSLKSIVPSVDAPNWLCNDSKKIGCMGLCFFQKDGTGLRTLRIVKRAPDLISPAQCLNSPR